MTASGERRPTSDGGKARADVGATRAEVDSQPVPTSQGPAAIRVFPADRGRERGTVLVGHGAGGQRDAADVLALLDLTADGWTVVLLDQPWRVAGRRVATAPPTLDLAWSEVLEALAQGGRAPDGIPLPRPWVHAGRSAGARVACRISVDGPPPPPGAVVALAFPLHPPGKPERSRAAELAAPLAAGIPTLVVQGGRDPMGTPHQIRQALGDPLPETLTLREVPGNHSPTRDVAALLDHVRTFLDRHLPRDAGVVGGPPRTASGDRPAEGPVASVGRTPSRTGAPTS
ncbi:alpha/beta hydrolase family protein [Ornithinimicrobium sufpigmenti]|uniref:alpha/beta hydrolase family protein n=1 Tax=Ornithinimicrobium sufpigmenti TaxID=2508882 RepID=UPI0010360476|nr:MULTISPECIES: alpha/beta family hydrolase [unclassified Ornithinimicrobium]